jgi:hypothetical protein
MNSLEATLMEEIAQQFAGVGMVFDNQGGRHDQSITFVYREVRSTQASGPPPGRLTQGAVSERETGALRARGLFSHSER